uniref:uncharacterized protein LOC124053699 isoform X2 n=1 Tax=Scatophagus argus TaxID=75038 RepID=UPI001ED8483C|nr:uncharacterized protein LOC124053699 isoform X2 [Scatophagus argus]
MFFILFFSGKYTLSNLLLLNTCELWFARLELNLADEEMRSVWKIKKCMPKRTQSTHPTPTAAGSQTPVCISEHHMTVSYIPLMFTEFSQAASGPADGSRSLTLQGLRITERFFGDECKFKETLLPNNYNAYESFVYKGFYIALSKHGRVKRGNKATTAMTVTHFLPRL